MPPTDAMTLRKMMSADTLSIIMFDAQLLLRHFRHFHYRSIR